ncbi:ABC transporter permease [Chitinolyticbacter albus]|uniref:ABC transporter permease n=1 Tax=Chitinolyticbacter albus TaxID=2961951 RepID=UPI00210BAB4B|nr:ABC transporter permease [Chitinolyticbacter albus]
MSRSGYAALIALTLLVGAALFAPWLAPQNPYDLAALDVFDARLPPGSPAYAGQMHYWLGTDAQGRDMLSAMLYGLRISLVVGFASTVLALLIGIVFGLIAAWRGGWVDALVMRIVDVQLSFPAILLALVLLAVTGPGLAKIVLALVAAQWAYYARATRGVALVERNKDYIAAARLLRLPSWRVLAHHLLPNCLPTLLVVAALQLAAAISLEATLSFLGIGLPVTEPSLGLLIANGFQYLLSGRYWISVFPGVLLVLLLVSCNVLADALRRLADPREAAR